MQGMTVRAGGDSTPFPSRSTFTPLSPRFEEALVYAARLHATQKRKGGNIPYISHLLSVTALVLEEGGNEDEAIAALLHDALEDRARFTSREEIARRFGEPVAAMVLACSECIGSPKPPWPDRKLAYLEHLRHATPSVRRISLADKLHNIRSLLRDYRQIGEALWTRFEGGRNNSLWFYQELLEIFRQGETSPNLDEYERLYHELRRLAGAGEKRLHPTFEAPAEGE